MLEIPTQTQAPPVEFFVTEECNGCGLCKHIAPDFFDYVDYAYYYFVSRQPRTELEVSLLRDVAAMCTVDAVRETTKLHG